MAARATGHSYGTLALPCAAPLSGSCPSTRRFASRFFQTVRSRSQPVVHLGRYDHQPEDFHLQVIIHPGHQQRSLIDNDIGPLP